MIVEIARNHAACCYLVDMVMSFLAMVRLQLLALCLGSTWTLAADGRLGCETPEPTMGLTLEGASDFPRLCPAAVPTSAG